MNERKIIDMHAHIFPDKIVEKAVDTICGFYDIPMKGKGTTAELLECIRELNIERTLVHSTATKAEQVRSINTYIIGEINAHSEFVGFGTLHPDYGDIEGEVEFMVRSGLKGVKLHPDFQRFNLDDERAQGIYKACSGKLPILFHIGDYRQDYSNPKRLYKMLEKYPELKVIAAHFGGWSVWEDGYEIFEPSENLYFDTSSSLYKIDTELVVKFIDKHGIDKFLFGTDYPMWTAKEEIGRVEALGLTQYEQERIFYENAKEFLEL